MCPPEDTMLSQIYYKPAAISMIGGGNMLLLLITRRGMWPYFGENDISLWSAAQTARVRASPMALCLALTLNSHTSINTLTGKDGTLSSVDQDMKSIQSCKIYLFIYSSLNILACCTCGAALRYDSGSHTTPDFGDYNLLINLSHKLL